MENSCEDLEEINFLLTNVEKTVPVKLESYLEGEYEGDINIFFDYNNNVSAIDKTIKNYDGIVSGYNKGIGFDLLESYKKKGLDKPFIIILEDKEQLNNTIKESINRFFLREDLENQYKVLVKAIVDEICYKRTGGSGFFTDYRVLFNSMEDTALVHDLEGNTLAVNDAALERLGYSREELLDMKPDDIDKSDHLKEVQKKIYNLEEGESLTFETKQVTKDGEEIPVEINSKLIRYRGRHAVLSIARDISEKKKALMTSKSYKKMIKRFFQRLPEPGILINTNERILSINSAFESNFGYDKTQVEGKLLENSDFIPLSQRQKVRKRFKARLEGKFLSSYEIPLQTKGKEIKKFSVYGFPLEKKDKVFGVIIILKKLEEPQEVKKLRTKSEKLRKIFNAMDDVLIFLNEDLEIEEINNISLEIFNQEKEELLGKKIYDVYNTRSINEGALKDLITSRNRIDLEIYDKNFDRYLEISNKPVKSTQSILGYVHHVKDISRRKEIEKREKYLHKTLKKDLKNRILNKIQTIDLLREIEEFEERKIINLDLKIQKAIDNNKKSLRKKNLDLDYQKKELKILGGQLLDNLFSFILEIIINNTNGDKIKIEETEREKEIQIEINDNGTKTPEKIKKIREQGISKKIESGWKIYLAKKIINKYQGSFELIKPENSGIGFKITLKSPKSEKKDIKSEKETQSHSKSETKESKAKGGTEKPWCEKCNKPMVHTYSTDKGLVYKCQTCGKQKIIEKHMSGTNVVKF